jgi:dTDP-4-amino-4,6-dideoxygalactose transaminase
LGYEADALPVTEQACREVLSLPVYPELTTAEQGAVIEAIADFCHGTARNAA